MCEQFFAEQCEMKRCPVAEEMAGFSFVLGLRGMAALAAQIGRTADTAQYTTLAAAATAGFHSRFWNTTSQAYGSDLSG